MSASAGGTLSCQVCGAEALEAIRGFGELARVTSDCRPFRKGGELNVCSVCGAAQKSVTTRWLQEIAEIYASYVVYRQGGGDEQLVLDPAGGPPVRRSVMLTRRLRERISQVERGAALDVGCGNGATLQALSEAFGSWRFHGHELHDAALPRLRKIPGFGTLFTGDLEALPGRFDLVTMIHSLEHFEAPLTTLMTLRERIVRGGSLFVEVCNVEQNPFDLVVADHLMHFSPDSLHEIATRAGFGRVRVETEWVKKELSMLASPDRGGDETVPSRDARESIRRVERQVRWLSELARDVRDSARGSRPFGVFGTSIAATWITTQLADEVEFFVDEDPSRNGGEFMGRPIVPPAMVPPGASVYMGLAPALANAIVGRLSVPGVRWILPPE